MKAHSPYRTVIWVLVVLVLLLSLAVGIYALPPFPGKTFLTLAVSGGKTCLVIWYFMRVRESSGMTFFYLGAGFIWLGLLMLLTATDYLLR